MSSICFICAAIASLVSASLVAQYTKSAACTFSALAFFTMASIWLVAGEMKNALKLGIGVLSAFSPLFAVIGILECLNSNEVNEWTIFAVVLLSCVSVVAIVHLRKESRNKATQEESAIQNILKDLPMPTVSQFERFIRDLRYECFPSKLQEEYRARLFDSDLGKMDVEPLGADDFLYMQAAWIYYSKADSNSSLRKYIFGEHGFRDKRFFDPSNDRFGMPVMTRSSKPECTFEPRKGG